MAAIESAAPPPKEPSRAQQDVMGFLFGGDGFQLWMEGFMPAKFQMPEMIVNDANYMYRISAADRREVGTQYLWKYGVPVPQRSLIRYGTSLTDCDTQHIGASRRLQEQNVPVIDLHTHPKQPTDEGFELAQHPSVFDLRALLEESNVMAMVVRSASALSCVVRSRSVAAGTTSIEDADREKLKTVGTNPKQHRGLPLQIARAVRPHFSLFTAHDPFAGDMTYIHPVRKMASRLPKD